MLVTFRWDSKSNLTARGPGTEEGRFVAGWITDPGQFSLSLRIGRDSYFTNVPIMKGRTAVDGPYLMSFSSAAS
jgi:hypothetical protein